MQTREKKIFKYCKAKAAWQAWILRKASGGFEARREKVPIKQNLRGGPYRITEKKEVRNGGNH